MSLRRCYFPKPRKSCTLYQLFPRKVHLMWEMRFVMVAIEHNLCKTNILSDVVDDESTLTHLYHTLISKTFNVIYILKYSYEFTTL